MEISGSYTIYAPRERVWEALHDPETLRGAVASVGMRMAGAAAKMLANAYFARLAEELAPAATAASPAASPEVREPAAAGSAATAPAPLAPVPTRAPAGPAVRLVRRLGLSDGSIESERRWARRLGGGVLLGGVALLTLVRRVVRPSR